jgi:hypothetical protein
LGAGQVGQRAGDGRGVLGGDLAGGERGGGGQLPAVQGARGADAVVGVAGGHAGFGAQPGAGGAEQHPGLRPGRAFGVDGGQPPQPLALGALEQAAQLQHLPGCHRVGQGGDVLSGQRVDGRGDAGQRPGGEDAGGGGRGAAVGGRGAETARTHVRHLTAPVQLVYTPAGICGQRFPRGEPKPAAHRISTTTREHPPARQRAARPRRAQRRPPRRRAPAQPAKEAASHRQLTRPPSGGKGAAGASPPAT